MKAGKKKPGKENKEENLSEHGAGLAFKHGFYLETAWILSALFEKKAKNVLKLIENDPKTGNYSFEQSIKRIDRMRLWKNNRNSMLTDMITIHVSQQRMERLAMEGISIYKKWSKSLKNVKNEIKNPGRLADPQVNIQENEE